MCNGAVAHKGVNEGEGRKVAVRQRTGGSESCAGAG